MHTCTVHMFSMVDVCGGCMCACGNAGVIGKLYFASESCRVSDVFDRAC